MKKSKKKNKATKAIHAGQLDTSIYGEVSVPIFQSSTFSFLSADNGAARFSGEEQGYIYTRMGNPTIRALEDNISTLENGFSGMATSSGMAAITTVFLSFLSQNEHIVSTDSLYGPSRMVLENEFSRYGVQSTFVDSTNPHNVIQAIQPNTKLIYVETPANPTMGITNISKMAEIAHSNDALLAVDNTFASPHLQRPFEYGADIVVHSLTKFLNGHSDVVGGMIIPRTENLHKRIRTVLNLFGGTMDPHQAWLVLRGVRTLALRVEKAQESAEKMAKFLQSHPKVTWIKYPGLPDHPQFEVAKKQMDGFGSMICFGVKNKNVRNKHKNKIDIPV